MIATYYGTTVVTMQPLVFCSNISAGAFYGRFPFLDSILKQSDEEKDRSGFQEISSTHTVGYNVRERRI